MQSSFISFRVKETWEMVEGLGEGRAAQLPDPPSDEPASEAPYKFEPGNPAEATWPATAQ
jgi:hypothetical protein